MKNFERIKSVARLQGSASSTTPSFKIVNNYDIAQKRVKCLKVVIV